MRTTPTNSITVVFFVFKTITSFTVRTAPTKSTVVFYVLKQLLHLQCVRPTYQKYGCFLCIKTNTSFTVRTIPAKTRTVVFFVFKTITSFAVCTIPTKSTADFYVLKRLLPLQCVRNLQKVRLFSMI